MELLSGLNLARSPLAQREAMTPIDGKARTDTPEEITKATEQFEALLIGQMLKQVRESGAGGWLGEGDDQAASHLMGLAEDQLAQALAAQGGMGLAQLTAGSVARESAETEAKRTAPVK